MTELTAIQKWLRQPSTINGVSLFLGIVSGTVSKIITKDVTLSAGIGGGVVSVIQMVMKDNSADLSPVEKFVQDAVTATTTNQLKAALPTLFSEGIQATDILVDAAKSTPVLVSAGPSVPVPPAPTFIPAVVRPVAPPAPPTPPAPPILAVLLGLVLLGASMFGLSACSTVSSVVPPAPADTAQAVYELEGEYGAALSVAVQYEGLPACGGATVICSSPAVEAQIKTAAASAWPMIEAAQSATIAGSPEASTLLQQATAALAVLTNLTSTLKVS